MEKSVAEQMAESMVAAVKAHVAAALGPLRAEIAELRCALATANESIGKQNEVIGKQIDFNNSVIARFDSLPAPINGKDGKDGVDGKDADGDAILAAIKAIVEAEVSALPKVKDGIDGKDGSDGLPGIKGLDGADGKDGKDGRDGHDALDIIVQDSIDESRGQPVGTWARHAGGLWVSRSQKPGLDSWECAVNGVANVDVKIDEKDERTVVITMTASDGEMRIHQFSLPVMIHRGVWEQREYERGDVTTRDGSCWHAEKTTSAEPGLPSSKDDWTLIVKRGRDFTPPEQRRSNGSTNDPVRLR